MKSYTWTGKYIIKMRNYTIVYWVELGEKQHNGGTNIF